MVGTSIGPGGGLAVPRRMTSPRSNLLGLRVMIDNQMLVAGGPAGPPLRQMDAEGWVNFHLADVTIAEITRAEYRQTRDDRLTDVSGRTVASGVHVLDHSLLDMSVLASDTERDELDAIHRMLRGRRFVDEDTANSKKAGRRVRDTMHIHTAARYAYDAFITHDKGIYIKAEELAGLYPNLRVVSPSGALRWLLNEVTVRRRHADANSLPSWPTDEDTAELTLKAHSPA